MTTPTLSAMRLALGLVCAVIWAENSSAAERRVALVIGNSAYLNAPALDAPRSDAQDMAAMFQKAAFDVVRAHYDVTNARFKQAIAQFADEATHSDIAIVYFSGYGIAVQGLNYLVPVDAKLANSRDAAGEAIVLDDLAKAVEGAKRLRLVILDASRDNFFARTMQLPRWATQQRLKPGLAPIEPRRGALIASAAIAGTEAVDGNGEHSIYTAALLHDLFVPGLDIRLAFARVLVEVWRKTVKNQTPDVYGSFEGRSVALIPAPRIRPARDLGGEKTDFSVLALIENAAAWEVFLAQHPAGFYSAAARNQVRLLDAESHKTMPPGPTAKEREAWARVKDSGDQGLFKSFIQQYPNSALADFAREAIEEAGQEQMMSEQLDEDRQRQAKLQPDAAVAQQPEAPLVPTPPKTVGDPDAKPPDKGEVQQQASLNPPDAAPAVNTPELVHFMQQELARLGCFSGAPDGNLNNATRAAVQLYRKTRGNRAGGDVDITDAFISELKRQLGRVCPLICPPGKIAASGRCIDLSKPAAVTRQKDVGGAARSGVTIGVGF